VDDNATVRLVTIVTLLYLPASFVAVSVCQHQSRYHGLTSKLQSILGMNLFAFQSADSSNFQISKQFWIFIVLTVPLTLITVGSWIVMARKRRRQRIKEREEQALSGGGEEEV
jgi:hypothetical protein